MKTTYMLYAMEQDNFFIRAEKGHAEISGVMLHGSGYDMIPNLNDKPEWINSILNIGGTPMHLYLVSNNKIKSNEGKVMGDWAYNSMYSNIFQMNGDITSFDWKIEATTNRNLGLPDIAINTIGHFMENENSKTELEIEYVSVLDNGCVLVNWINITSAVVPKIVELKRKINIAARSEISILIDGKNSASGVLEARKKTARLILQDKFENEALIDQFHYLNGQIKLFMGL